MGISIRIDGGTIVSPRGRMRAGLAVDDGKIVAIGKESELPKAGRTIDAAGRYVLPGVVDPHVHFRYVDTSIAEGFEILTRSAAVGGVTTVLPFIASTDSIVASLDIFKQVYEMAALVDGSFHAVIFEPGQIPELGELIKQGVTSFKFLLPYQKSEALEGVGDIDEGLIFLGMREIAKAGALAMVHCESPDLFFRLRDELLAKEPADPHWHDARPNECEAHAIATMSHLAKLAECPLYVVHISIKEGGDLIRRARAEGVRVWAETCPQYLTLTRFDTDKVWGKINPPLRGEEDVEQLWREIGEGTFDCIGSDHCPLSPEEKGDDLWTAKVGMPGVETMLPLLLDRGVNAGRISLERLTRLCCENPARIFGIYPQKGVLQVGSDADMVIIDLEEEHTIELEKMHDVYSYSAYDGWTLKGRPVMTMVRGKIVAENGDLVGEPGYGRFIPASLPPA